LTKWTKKTIRAEATKYRTRSEFIKNAPGAYQAAKRIGISQEIFPLPLHKNWSKENIIFEALKYETKAQFKKYSPVAYRKACKLGIHPEIMAMMPYYNKRGTNENRQSESERKA
jgi:hypothetical protein